MANRIDRFIDAMHRKGAQKLLFETGKPVRIVVGNKTRVILDKNVRSDQIDKLVVPVLSTDDGTSFINDDGGSYGYDAPRGPVTIESRREAGWISVEIRPKGGTAELQVVEPELFTPAPLAAQSAPKEPKPLTRSFRMVGRTPGEGPIIDKILTQLAESGGSDLHLTTGQRPKMRKDGEIIDIPGWDVLTSDDVQSWMLDVAAKRVQDEYLETNDADYAHEVKGVARFRMNIFRDRNGTGAVIRTIPSTILTAEQLGLPDSVNQFCDLQKGLVCVTGPTGSGKSTTLAAMIDYINKGKRTHIITMEDPIEFVHKSRKSLINQREMGVHSEGFKRALKSALRQDPDIVLVGELRDIETVSMAIETANTGHLVFGTLHTSTAISTVERIVDLFPPSQQGAVRAGVAEALKGVIAQTLCRRKGGGRIAALEIMVGSMAISNMIREGKLHQIQNIMLTAKKQGNQLLNEEIEKLIRSGKVEYEEGMSKSIEKAELAKRFGREYFEE